jgi:hypothetical protein
VDISPTIIILAALIIFFAFYIRALTGFGGALISIPLLALLFDLKFVVPLESLFEVGISALLIKKVYRKIDGKSLVPLLTGALAGTLLGGYILKSFANDFLVRILGLLIILFSLNLLRQSKKDQKALPSLWGYVAGVIGGTLGGMFGTSGPPFVVYLTYQLKKKDVLRATLIGLFTLDFTWRLGVFAANGLLTLGVIKLALLLAPALLIGTILGHHTHLRVGEEKFRRLTALVLTASGVLLLVR